MSIVTKFIFDETGATAIEYGLIAAGVSVVIIGAVAKIGEGLSDLLWGINTVVSARSADGGSPVPT